MKITFCSIGHPSVSTHATSNIQFKHIKRTYLNSPYTNCVADESKEDRYTKYGCLEILLLKNVCQTCNCYPSYISAMQKIVEDNVAKDLIPNCRNMVLL